MPALKKTCWGYLSGYCPRGTNCIFTHSTSVNQNEKRPAHDFEPGELTNWEQSARSETPLTPADLSDMVGNAAIFFIDGDEGVRRRVLRALTTETSLEHICQCLNPRFLLQKHTPAINYQGHVRPLLSILSDPLLSVPEETLACVKRLYELVMNRANGGWWRQIMDKIDEEIEIQPISVGRTMSAVMMIFMTYIDFDASNHTNMTIRDCIPRLRSQIERLKEKERGGMLSPKLIESFQILDRTVATSASQFQVTSMVEASVTQQTTRHSAGKIAVEKRIDESRSRQKAAEISRGYEVRQYLGGVQLDVQRGHPVPEIGLTDEEQEREFHQEDYQEE
ncbi:hypothetical protein AA313_de0209956 [Arthrobotrys entomopaga]|nr:hypothetical protein AA313_de0209956 [Arthrobotrys entomopaga]